MTGARHAVRSRNYETCDQQTQKSSGQLNAVIRMLEEGSDCRAVVTQLSAASKAIDRAGFSIIATGLEKCLESDDPTVDRAEMEKLFLSLA